MSEHRATGTAERIRLVARTLATSQYEMVVLATGDDTPPRGNVEWSRNATSSVSTAAERTCLNTTTSPTTKPAATPSPASYNSAAPPATAHDTDMPPLDLLFSPAALAELCVQTFPLCHQVCGAGLCLVV